jgi:hypothetical protein
MHPLENGLIGVYFFFCCDFFTNNIPNVPTFDNFNGQATLSRTKITASCILKIVSLADSSATGGLAVQMK